MAEVLEAEFSQGQEEQKGQQEAKKSEEQKKQQEVAVIRADQMGVLLPRDINEAWRLAGFFHASGFLPARFDTQAKVLTAMQFARELGLPPLSAMRQIAVVEGTPSLFGDLPLSLCYRSGQLEWIREYLLDEQEQQICLANKNLKAKVWGAVCVVKRRNDLELVEAVFSLDDARNAGLFPAGPKAAWTKYPKRMLRYRARSMALKDKMPDCLNGIAIAEYDFHELPDMIEPEKKASPSEGKSAEDMSARLRRLAEENA